MTEEIEVQTVGEVKNIDYMRTTTEQLNNTITQQTNNIDTISNQLDTIVGAVQNMPTASTSTNVDLSEITDLVENIDTTIIEVQTYDILNMINSQQAQIDNIENTISVIDDKLTQILKKL